MKIDKNIIKELSDYLDEYNLTEIEITEKDTKIKVSKNNVSITDQSTVASSTTKYQSENINDRLNEWQLIDSSGFSMPQGLDTILEIFEYVEANNRLTSHRLTSYIQQNGEINFAQTKFNFNIGLRSHYWSMNKEYFLSPRAGISFLPDWEKDVLIKFSVGSYNQSPFYRELRDKKGNLFTQIKSQKSIHFVVAADYNFSS